MLWKVDRLESPYLFVVLRNRSRRPLLPPRPFRNPTCAGARAAAALLGNGGTVAAFTGRDAGRADWNGTRRAVLDMWALAVTADAAVVTAHSSFALAASALFPKPTWVVGSGGGAGAGCERLADPEPSCENSAGRYGCR